MKEIERKKELKSLLRKYNCSKYEIREIDELEEYEQIGALEELLKEYKDYETEANLIKKYKALVEEYKEDSSYPVLATKPHGSLFNKGFIYDEDEDDRVLIAIEKLKNMENIIAVYEHKGSLTLYSKYACEIKEIEVCGDLWYISEFTPQNGKWVECKNSRSIRM